MLDYSLPNFSPQIFYGTLYLNSRIFSFHWRHVVAAVRPSFKMSSHTSNRTPTFIIQSLIRHNDLSYFGATPASRPGPPDYWLYTITLRHTTIGRNPLEEWSALRRDLYLAGHNSHNRRTSVPSAGFEPTNPTSERPQTHTRPLESAGTVIRLGLYLQQVSVLHAYTKNVHTKFWQ